MDAATWQNLLSFCRQEFEAYELLIGTVDDNDPVVPLLRRLAALYPDRVRLFIGLAPRGPNHKDSILAHLLEAARYDIAVFADVDMRPRPGYLKMVTAPLEDPSVGLVTCVYADRNPGSVSQAMASLGRCADFIPNLLLGEALAGGLRFGVGVTLATRRQTLNAAGGLCVNRIGSDYNLGRRIAESGYRVVLSSEVLDWATEREPFRQLFLRELRWARTTRWNHGAQYYGVALCYGTIYSLALILVAGGASWSLALAFVAFAARTSQSMVCLRAFDCRELWHWLCLLPARDGLSLAVWIGGTYGRNVVWRGRRLRIQADGLITEISSTRVGSWTNAERDRWKAGSKSRRGARPHRRAHTLLTSEHPMGDSQQ
jgi:ceramide glucosyltransferase